MRSETRTALRRASLTALRLAWRAALATAAAMALVLPTGCGAGLPAHGRPVARVLVIGVDGLEWSVLRPLIAAGRCPNLRGLMERGAFGRLATLKPTLSPVIWTTIATGRLPRDHGILDFLDEQGRVYTSARRAVPALWNIADRFGLTSNVVGWWNTFPAEPVAGVVVSGCNAAGMVATNWKPALVPGIDGQVHPAELEAEILRIAGEAGDQPAVEAARRVVFGDAGLDVEGAADASADPRAERQAVRLAIQQTLWSLQADAAFTAVAEHLLRTRPADLNLVYLASPDVTGHRFWRPHEPDAFRWRGDPASDAALAGAVPADVAWVDGLIGRLVAAAGPETTVLVLSDHGMHAVATEAPPARAPALTGHHLDAPPGVLIAAGPGIAPRPGLDDFLRSGVLAPLGSVVDTAPTVLALLGIPGARDMAGRAFLPLLAPGPAMDAARAPLVESHDEAFRPPAIVPAPPEIEQDFLERFRALGYIEAPLEPPAPSESGDATAPAGGASQPR